VILICGFIFWQFAWKLAPIPSSQYPDAEVNWPLRALYQTFWMTATSEGESPFLKALNLNRALAGLGLGLVALTGMTVARAPVTLVYGFIGGMGALPHSILPTLGGALLGRHYFERRVGREQWRRYAVVLLAGYQCGTGLIALGAASLAMIARSVSNLPY
jgi:hypothetical protein